MSYANDGFDARLGKLRKNRARMAHGYVSKVGRDGLIVFRPKRRAPSFPWRGLMLIVVGAICFKGLIMAHYGADAYDGRLATLQQGTMLEQLGASVMAPDPVSSAIAKRATPLFW